MDKIIDITKILQETAVEEKQAESKPVLEKVTNPIFKKLAQFKNSKLSSKLDIKDLLR